ncbi:MAG: phosphoribosyltransferase [Herpetosiphonaceae bacterium]|nr:phosphoribosyltransferase [Herpetosiphonaceae bacterium]
MPSVESINWERFEQLTHMLAEQIAPFDPQIIIGIARGGLFPATLLSFILRHELYPIRLAYHHDDSEQPPIWLVPPPTKVDGRRVLVVHETAESGRTLALAAAEIRALGASQVRTASLYAHTWANPRPDYVALTSDALILSPWDRAIFIDGQWSTHPELSAALHNQSTDADAPPS